MKYKLINKGEQNTYAIIMDSGDEVMEQLMAFAEKEKLNASQFTAIGAFIETITGF
ncbi:PCC domain-containing protein, partial [Arachidicoccus sp.]|uniref:PCC domain-containing protein n=1 Tax=Arachidicoccus sp. TaxID=1872624 RepID=UPI003D1AFC72